MCTTFLVGCRFFLDAASPMRAECRYEFDVVRTERAHNARLIEKIAREGVPIYPEHTSA